MELENICCDLEISKSLKEKGFRQDGLWIWVIAKRPSDGVVLFDRTTAKNCNVDKYSAPTAEELLMELPKVLENDVYDDFYLDLRIYEKESECFYKDRWEERTLYINDEKVSFVDKKLCNALAKMWIYLKDNGLLKSK